MSLVGSRSAVETSQLTALYLFDSSDDVDAAILRDWVAEHGARGADWINVPHPRSQDSVARLVPLAERISAEADILLSPVRVAWFADEKETERSARLRDLVSGDPRNPSVRDKRRILKRDPGRARVIVAQPAPLSEVSARTGAPSAGNTTALAGFVARQALLALERAEYRVRGARYKVPRLVREELEGSASFRARGEALADKLGRPRDEVWAEVDQCLDEMVTGYSRLFLDLMARLGTRIKRPGYGDEIDYDEAQLQRVRETLARYPAIILPSHKSNLDALIIPVALHENGLPPTHTFAGINMAFWPFGSIFRRAGRIFIRRDMSNDPVYRWVLREYLAYLVEKRFTLEWYIEGTRSRTGKLAPPKMGLLRYVADACREGRTDDVALLPVSIVYDQLDEVREFASEAKGGAKKAETIGWALKFIRSQHGTYGRIYVRFGEPISLREAIEGDVSDVSDTSEMSELSDDDIRLQKLAFEVCTRINAVTPITASALICMVLLATRGRALSARELHTAVGRLLGQIRARNLPLAASAESLATFDGVRSVVQSLSDNGTIEVYEQGDEPVYLVERGEHLAAAFYRNTIVHFFIGGAIAEVALVHAAESATLPGELMEEFWAEADRMRDLLKFDFFFEQRDQFRESVAAEFRGRLDDWEEQLGAGVEPRVILDQMQPLHAFAVMRPFIEAYLIVARVLVDESVGNDVDRKALTKKCLALGGQWLRQDRIRSPEAVSKYLFEAAIKLAEHRGLTIQGPQTAELRRAFFEELVDIARRIDVVEQQTYDAAGRLLTRGTL